MEGTAWPGSNRKCSRYRELLPTKHARVDFASSQGPGEKSQKLWSFCPLTATAGDNTPAKSWHEAKAALSGTVPGCSGVSVMLRAGKGGGRGAP